MNRRQLLAASAASTFALSATTGAQEPRATFLVVHGGSSGGWAWKKMHPLMAAQGHRLITPTLTGHGEREHLLSASVDLETNVQDVLGVIKFEDLRNFVLIGHSYGGMVATIVADRVPELIKNLVYLDAFVPRDGQAVFDLVTRPPADGNWRLPPRPLSPDISKEDAEWMAPRMVSMSRKTHESPARLSRGDTKVSRSYILCKPGAVQVLQQFADRAKKEKWGYYEIASGHSPHVTAPVELTRVLTSIARA